MNTHVNFEIAKLLKEKGFNEPCFDAYNIQGMKFSNGWLEYIADNDIELPFTKKDLNPQDTLAPTITEVVMWLYEKYGVWICVDMVFGDDQTGFWYCIRQSKEDDITIQSEEYETSSEAFEAAIKHVLEKIV